MKGTSKKRSSPPDGAIVFRGALQVNGRQVAADKSTRQKTSSSGKDGGMGKDRRKSISQDSVSGAIKAEGKADRVLHGFYGIPFFCFLISYILASAACMQ